MAHAAARSALGFAIARAALGLGEAGNFPASIKTVAEWFPKQERALATGIFNAGSNIGAIAAPILVPWIALTYGWQWAFLITGALGFVWLLCWLLIYRRPEEHSSLRRENLSISAVIPPKVQSVAWAKVFPKRQTWAFAIGKFLTDPVWWFFLFWLPKFLNQQYGLTIDKMGLPLVVIYLAADIGSIGGGWLSSDADQARLDGERLPKNRDARMRAVCRADYLRRKSIQPVGRGGACQSGHVRRIKDGRPTCIPLPRTCSPETR